MRRYKVTLTGAILGILLLSGCVATPPVFHVYVDSINAPGVERKTY